MARSFTGTDVVNPATVNLGNAAKSCCFFAKQASAVNNARWIDTTGITLFQIYYGTVNNRFTIAHFGSGTTGLWYVNAADHGLTLTNWFFFGWSWDGNIANVPLAYVAAEGAAAVTPVTVTVNTAPTGVPNADASVNVWIGNSSNGLNPCNGSMAHPSVFDRVASQAEFNEALQAATAGNPGGSGRGRWALDATNPATDLSGNGHDGAITGTSVVADPSFYSVAGGGVFPSRSRRNQRLLVR